MENLKSLVGVAGGQSSIPRCFQHSLEKAQPQFYSLDHLHRESLSASGLVLSSKLSQQRSFTTGLFSSDSFAKFGDGIRIERIESSCALESSFFFLALPLQVVPCVSVAVGSVMTLRTARTCRTRSITYTPNSHWPTAEAGDLSLFTGDVDRVRHVLAVLSVITLPTATETQGTTCKGSARKKNELSNAHCSRFFNSDAIPKFGERI